MGLSTPAVRIAAGAALLLLILSPPAAAQLPVPLFDGAMHLVVRCNDSLIEPPFSGQDEVSCVLSDLSRDSLYVNEGEGGTGASQHSFTFVWEVGNASVEAKGWDVETDLTPRGLYGGDQIPFVVRVTATPMINTQEYEFFLVIDYSGPGDYQQTIRVPFRARVGHYDMAQLGWAGGQVQSAGQDEIVTMSIVIQNLGVYPDTYRIVVSAAPDIRVSQPPNVHVPAQESRVVNITLLTPHGKLYELSRSESIGIKVNSLSGGGTYGTFASLKISGPYVPTYWLPLLLVGLASTAVVARGAREKAELRSLERGRPRRVEITPRQAVLLAELKRSDPDAYREKKRSLDNVYKERVADYRAHRKERLAADRAEAKQARLEFIAAKKARKEQRKREKAEAKVRAKEAKRAAKLQRIEDKKEAKLLKKKEKVLAKKRKVLEKERAKAEKREAKLAAKQAKADAKAAKLAEREAKKQKRQ